MTNYSQTLDEIFNILCMHLPIDRNQRLSFIGYFMNVSMGASSTLRDTFDLTMPTGQRIMTIEVFEFVPPVMEPNPEFYFDLIALKATFQKYFDAQTKARQIFSKHQAEQLNQETSANPQDMFKSSNTAKPFRTIEVKDFIPELNINYDEFKISPNIPNMGRASL